MARDISTPLNRWFDNLGHSGDIRIAVGFASVSGLKTLFEKTDQDANIRLLVGEFIQPSTAEGNLSRILTDSKEMNTNDSMDTDMAEELYDRLNSSFSIRTSQDLHSKVYLSDPDRMGVVGSSNLTKNGIRSNVEYNIILTEEQYNQTSKWFEKAWSESQPITSEAIVSMEKSSHGGRLVDPPIRNANKLKRVTDIPDQYEPEEFTQLSLASKIALLDAEVSPDRSSGKKEIQDFHTPDIDVEYFTKLLIRAVEERSYKTGFREFIKSCVDEWGAEDSRKLWKVLKKIDGEPDIPVKPDGMAWLLEWWLKSSASYEEVPDAGEAEDISGPILEFSLWDHQKEALERWNRSEQEGIIEMATGTGKTVVALSAIEKVYEETGPFERPVEVLIVTDSNALLNQWEEKIESGLGIRVQKDDAGDPIVTHPSPNNIDMRIRIITVQKITQYNFEEYSNTRYDLMIVDEVHHYTKSDGFGRIADLEYERVMGLSATLSKSERERVDLGEVLYEYSLSEAIDDGIIPEFNYFLHSVSLSGEEKEKYDKKTHRLSKLYDEIKSHDYVRKIIDEENLRLDEFNMGVVFDIMEHQEEGDLPDELEAFLSIARERREIVYGSREAKYQAVKLASEYANEGLDCIIFSMRKRDARDMYMNLDEKGVSAKQIHTDVGEDPEKILRDFENSDSCNILIGVKMLDEGIDVPEVDVGINVAAEKNEKQLTQRQGRILRRGGDYVPVFHHFVVKEEMTHYADLSSVTPKRGSPTPRIEESLPVSVGTIDIWDIYNSANPAILEQIREADSVNELDMTGEEWWLQIYLDKHRSAEDHRMFLEKLDGL